MMYFIYTKRCLTQLNFRRSWDCIYSHATESSYCHKSILKVFILHFNIINGRSFFLLNPAGTPGYRKGTESFFGLKGHPSVVRDVKIHNQPVLRMRRK